MSSDEVEVAEVAHLYRLTAYGEDETFESAVRMGAPRIYDFKACVCAWRQRRSAPGGDQSTLL
jgi:hypothetical protein